MSAGHPTATSDAEASVEDGEASTDDRSKRSLEAANRELRHALSLQTATLDATHDGILVVDLEGTVVSYNEQFQRIWGIPDALAERGDDDELIAHVLDQLVDPEGFTGRIREIYDDPASPSPEEAIEFKDGSVVQRSSQPQRLDGEIIGRVWSFRDATEEVTAKRELEASNAELQQFAYIISHDLQEPLRMVRSYVQLLERRYGDALDEDAHDFIRFASEGVERMQALIKGLLAFSRVETRGGDFQTVEVGKVLEGAVANLKVAIEEANASVTWDEMPTVQADPAQLGQVLQNLIANAIRFRGPETPPTVHLATQREDDAWRFTVEDNGVGIAPEHHERIFEIFQQLSSREDREGTGLGLALVKRIVERHGGRIGVDSSPGEGSVFWFTLPDEPG